ncbi:MAG TPA: FAD-dependent oxidoreductase [Pseudonocardia sp.]|nr:FAD-dependent oxidoreductase [Pseudonocardia sp.]
MDSRATPWRMKARQLVTPDPGLPRQVGSDTTAVVIGGGVAGVSAAVVLAERGVRVTLLEAADHLGGRLGAWPHTLADGTQQVVEHGFHAFFRQYYTWRAVLRRIDPDLGFLAPIGGYPVISRRWPAEDLTGLPAAPPFSLLTLFARSPSLGLRDITGADRRLALELLGYHRDRTTRALDGMSAGDFLDRFGITDRARAMLFEAFARSFFCDPAGMSAAELVAMFHFYFLGNPEGLGFDAPDTDYLTCIWRPLTEYLHGHGAEVRTGSPVRELEPTAEHAWRVHTDGGDLVTRHVVLALDPGGLRTLVGGSSGLARIAPRLAGQVEGVRIAPPFAVSRLWLDRDVAPERATFSAVTGEQTLDSVACYHRLEAPSRDWAEQTGGSVLELHSYSCGEPDSAAATERMRSELAALWPETADAVVIHQLCRHEATAPAFPMGGSGARPGVRTDARGVRVAGDFVEIPWCAGLMERSAMSGVLAANDVLAEAGVAAEPVTGVPQRGLLAGWTPFTRRD